MATTKIVNLFNVGLTNSVEITVTKEMSAESLGSGLLPVYATPSMIALMENTCAKCVEPYLKKGEGTVGTFVQAKHISATPIGCKVVCHCCLVEIDRKKLIFEVKCQDDFGLIGEGRHERFIIDNQRFMDNVSKKLL